MGIVNATWDLVWYMHDTVIPAALKLLPGQMDSREAMAMLIAIGLQESEFQHRKQVGGPAMGFWQFERGGGVRGVLTHHATGPIILPIVQMLRYPTTDKESYEAIRHNDILAACFARLLLWTDPRKLPSPIEDEKGWSIYVAQWRPGKPHHDKWRRNFHDAWRVVKGEA